MTPQRKRGVKMKIFTTAKRKDVRDNWVVVPDGNYHAVRGVVQNEDSSVAELPGQQEITNATIIVPVVGDLSAWSRVEFDGRKWDFSSPPQLQHSRVRRLRHVTADVRSRDSSEGARGNR